MCGGGGGQNFIYESIVCAWGGGGSQMNFISFSAFLASKYSGFWGASTPRPPVLSLFFSSFMTHFSPPPPKNGNMKRYVYAEMSSVRFFCGSVHRHLIIRKYRHFIRCILFPTSIIRKVNLQHPHPTRNVIVPC